MENVLKNMLFNGTQTNNNRGEEKYVLKDAETRSLLTRKHCSNSISA